MSNTKIVILSLVMVVFIVLFILAFAAFESGTVTVYGDEYMDKYFQRDQVMQVNIEIDAADWEKMMADPTAEEFVTATVIVNGDEYPSVRIRTKGNSSLRSVAGSDSNRYSFKINFNDLIQSQTMAGLTQLNLNNCFSDPSYMREYLSYQIFEEMGVPVPAFAYAAVHVNGEYFGLYLAVESILEPYLERNFGDITGDLYKSIGNNLEYNGDDPSDYAGLEVKSTRKNAAWSELIEMLDVLNNGGDDIEKYLDVDAALKYIAVNTALVNFDSYLGNFAHNYYLYGQNGVFTILPWDLNMSFGGFNFGNDVSRLYIDEPVLGALADRPLVARLLENEDYLQTYHEYLEQVTTNYLSEDYLETETARLFELISEYVRTDPTAFYTYEQFEQNISGMITGGAGEDENRAVIIPEQQGEENKEFARRDLQRGEAGGMGHNVPGILELAATVSESIHKQLSGEMPSTNNGNGMDTGKGMPMDGGGPGQQGPGENVERVQENGEKLPGEMPVPPQGMDREAGGNRPMGMGQQQPPIDGTVLNRLLALSGGLIIAGITIVLFFKRRRYNRLDE